MNPELLIECINKSCKKTISQSFYIKPQNNNAKFDHYVINGTSSAVSKGEQVKVFPWFANFWLFLRIKFEIELKTEGGKMEKQINTLISLSVFQGDDSDNKKTQLFRAEWDDHNNPDEIHAQPHWHITSSQAIENIFETYTGIFDKQELWQEFEKEKGKVIDVKEIHFAMNGDWQNNKNHVHKVNSEQQIVNWLQGMLNHVRTELEGLPLNDT